jgi:hypothetical protein
VRPTLTVTLAAAVLAASACGSQSRVGARTPRLPTSVATELAARSDALAAALARGDGCAATTQVHGLERQARTAVVSGLVPVAYRAPLTAAVTRLARRVPGCEPAPPPPPSADEQAKAPKNDDHHHKPKKHHEENDT